MFLYYTKLRGLVIQQSGHIVEQQHKEYEEIYLNYRGRIVEEKISLQKSF
jgi:hypothetical protein